MKKLTLYYGSNSLRFHFFHFFFILCKRWSLKTVLYTQSNQKMNIMLNIGDTLPLFTAQTDEEKEVQLGGNATMGKSLVIYFYPKDDTPGCTKEACAFRDSFADFEALGATVYGVSGDSPASHRKFREKYRLPYRLLTDPNKEIRKLFGVPTNLLGLIPGRVTYVINTSGKISHIFNSQGQAEKHITEALSALNNR